MTRGNKYFWIDPGWQKSLLGRALFPSKFGKLNDPNSHKRSGVLPEETGECQIASGGIWELEEPAKERLTNMLADQWTMEVSL